MKGNNNKVFRERNIGNEKKDYKKSQDFDGKHIFHKNKVY